MNKPTQEEIEAYKERAGREFDNKHGLGRFSERDGHDRNHERGNKKQAYKEKSSSEHHDHENH